MSISAYLYVHSDSRIPGFPECRACHFTGFSHVVVSCRRNQLAILPHKFKQSLNLGKKTFEVTILALFIVLLLGLYFLFKLKH